MRWWRDERREEEREWMEGEIPKPRWRDGVEKKKEMRVCENEREKRERWEMA